MTHFTRIAAAAALSLASAGVALAADLPARVAPPAPYVAPLPVFTWTGPYFGINAGYAFDNKENFTTPANTTILGRGFSDDGFTAGGQIGYNYQLPGFGVPGSGIVVGLEADAAYMDTGKSINVPGFGGASTSFRSGLDFLGTVRGRVGYAWNQILIYGTGGFAYGDVNSRLVAYGPGGASVLSLGRSSGFNTGYTYGGGVEYALPTTSFLNFFHSSAVTVKAEYLRYNLDSSNLRDSGLGTVALPGGIKVKNEGNIARIGLNYKF